MTPLTDTPLELLEECASTQDEVRSRLDAGAAAVCVAAVRQAAGRGRDGRSWETAPEGEQLLMSIGLRGAFATSVLDSLPRHVGSVVRRALCAHAPVPVERLGWKEPNDLIDEASGAKAGGILLDVETTEDVVTQLIIGIGANITGRAFRTSDQRAATTLQAMSFGAPTLDVAAMRARIARDVIELIEQGGGSYASRATTTL